MTILLLLVMSQTIPAKVIDKILVIVGDKIITQYEVESFNPKRVKEIYSKKDQSEREFLMRSYYKNVLDFLIDQYTIEIAAGKEGVNVSDEDVKKAIDQVIEKNKITRQQLEEALYSEGITLSQYEWQIKMDILKARLNAKVLFPLIVITEDDIKKYVDDNKEELGAEDQFELRIIDLKNRETASIVEDKLKQKTSFADLAIKYSEDKTAKSGGYVGWIKVSFLPENIAKEINGKKAGEVVKIESDEGYKFLQIEGFKSKYDIPSDKKAEIIDKLRQTRYGNAFESWLEKHKKNIFTKYTN